MIFIKHVIVPISILSIALTHVTYNVYWKHTFTYYTAVRKEIHHIWKFSELNNKAKEKKKDKRVYLYLAEKVIFCSIHSLCKVNGVTSAVLCWVKYLQLLGSFILYIYPFWWSYKQFKHLVSTFSHTNVYNQLHCCSISRAPWVRKYISSLRFRKV